jgi:hypothetical protein
MSREAIDFIPSPQGAEATWTEREALSDWPCKEILGEEGSSSSYNMPYSVSWRWRIGRFSIMAGPGASNIRAASVHKQ